MEVIKYLVQGSTQLEVWVYTYSKEECKTAIKEFSLMSSDEVGNTMYIPKTLNIILMLVVVLLKNPLVKLRNL